jgi:hypothetical protein
MPFTWSPCATRRDLPPVFSRRNAVALPSMISVPVSTNWPGCRRFFASEAAAGAGLRVGLNKDRSTMSRWLAIVAVAYSGEDRDDHGLRDYDGVGDRHACRHLRPQSASHAITSQADERQQPHQPPSHAH